MHRGRPPFFIPHNRPNSNVEEFAAPPLLGAVWNWCLYGALVVQFYVYSYNFPQGSRYVKLLVYSIFFLETVQTVLSGYSLYDWFTADFGNSKKLDSSPYYYFEVPLMGSMVSLIVRLFFVYRILVLSEKRLWWLCIIICLVSIVGSLGEFASGIISMASIWNKFHLVVSEKVSNMVWFDGLVGNVLSDLLIASTMLYLLRRIWARDGKLSSHAFVSLVRITVESNLAITTVSIATLLMVRLFPDENWFTCPYLILGKLHSNTLLVSVNNRILIPDSYEARGAAVDIEVVTGCRRGASPGIAIDGTILRPENPQNNCMNKPVAEAEVEKSMDGQ